MSFKDLGLIEALLKAVAEHGYSQPSPIQQKCIPPVLEGKDVLASAQTGTGKTAGFTLPILQRLQQGGHLSGRPVRALILTPTRELAAQIHANVVAYSKYLDIRSTVIFGGVNQNPQVNALRNGIDVLIATPGRLLDLHQQGFVKLNRVEVLVLDEADRMLDMGFVHDIKRIMALIPPKRQNLLFSATFSKEILHLADTLLNSPIRVEAAPKNTAAEMVEQRMYRIDKAHKAAFLSKLIIDGDWRQVLIFTRTKHGANALCKKLEKHGITAAAIHGNKTQNNRTKALAGFKDGSIRLLVATDIAARGLDIPLLPHVVNYELPNVSADYVHRIGRTGRAGASGEAVSLVGEEELEYVKGIEKLLNRRFELEVVSEFKPTVMPKQDAVSTASKPQQKQTQQQSQNGQKAKPKKRWFNRKRGSGGQHAGGANRSGNAAGN